MKLRMQWMPALVLGAGWILTTGSGEQALMPLRAELAETVPEMIVGYSSTDVEISENEQAVAGMDHYLYRVYQPEATTAEAPVPNFSLYVGYYEGQTQGGTIHSPRNCLPGAGWEALTFERAEIPMRDGSTATVNQYVIQNDDDRALVLYWYQGRGRVQASEFAVKWDLLRDAALHRRTEEALVRVIVPMTAERNAVHELAHEVAREIIPAVGAALPKGVRE